MRAFFQKIRLTNTFALQAYQVMRQAALIFTSIFLAKSGLGLGDIGTYESLLYLGTVVTFFWVAGLLNALPPLYVKLPEGERKAFIFNAFLVFCGISVGLTGLLFFGKSLAMPMLPGLSDAAIFPLFCAYLLFHLPTFPVEYFYLLQNRPGRILLWGGGSFGLHLVFLVAPIWLGWGLRGGVGGLVLLSALRFFWAVNLVRAFGAFVFRKNLVQHLLRFAAPMMAGNLVSNFVLVFDAWLAAWWFSDAPDTFAIYRYGARELPLAGALVFSLGTSLVPVLTENPEAGMALLKAKSRRLWHFLFPATIVLIATAKPLFPLVFNPDFAASAPIFNIYLLMMASRVLLPNAVVLARGATGAFFWVGLCELAVKVVLGFVFIKIWGLPGLAWSAVLAYWVEKIGLVLVLRKRFGIPIGAWLDGRWYLFYVAAMLAAFLVFGR